MSFATAFNAAIAVVRGDMKAAKEYVRNEKIPPHELVDRLRKETNKVCRDHAILCLKVVLREALHLEPPARASKATKDAYYAGVTGVEELIEKWVKRLEEPNGNAS